MAQKMVEATQVLVIVRHSFPFFNRKVDGAIFKHMTALQKVYIQDPSGPDLVQTVQELCQLSQNVGKTEIIPFENVSQFLVPRELD